MLHPTPGGHGVESQRKMGEDDGYLCSSLAINVEAYNGLVCSIGAHMMFSSVHADWRMYDSSMHDSGVTSDLIEGML